MFERGKQVRWWVLVVFLVVDYAITVLAVLAFNSNLFGWVTSATGGLINETLVVNLLALGILALILFLLGGLRPGDVGWLKEHILPGLALTFILWAAVQVVGAVLVFVEKGALVLHPSFAKPGLIAVLGLLLAQLLGNTVYEETAYRGFLLPQIYGRAASWARDRRVQLVLALVISQSFFALRHVAIRLYEGMAGTDLVFGLLYLMVLGTGFAVVYLRTGNLFFAMGFHTLMNAPTSLFSVSGDTMRIVILVVGVVMLVAWPLLAERRPVVSRWLPAASK